MHASRRAADRFAPAIALWLTVGFSGAPVAAEGPPGAREAYLRAQASFVAFAESWLASSRRVEVRGNGTDGETGPTPRPDPNFSVELRATGRRTTPFVGLLHYQERVYRCAGRAADACEVTRIQPVTEIFRFQDGHWVH